MRVEIRNKGDGDIAIVSTADPFVQVSVLKIDERVTVEADEVELVDNVSIKITDQSATSVIDPGETVAVPHDD